MSYTECGFMNAGTMIRPAGTVLGAYIDTEMHCGIHGQGCFLFRTCYTKASAYPAPRRQRDSVLGPNLSLWTGSHQLLENSTYVGKRALFIEPCRLPRACLQTRRSPTSFLMEEQALA